MTMGRSPQGPSPRSRGVKPPTQRSACGLKHSQSVLVPNLNDILHLPSILRFNLSPATRRFLSG